jgi:hypothetical protein
MPRSFLIFFVYGAIFLLGLELASFTAFKVNKVGDGIRDTKGGMERSSLYENLNLEKYKTESKAVTFFRIFDPYRAIRVRPNFKGEFVNTDGLGLRYTKGSLTPTKKDEITIALFGGSTMWGIGSESDLHTIPSLLFSELNNKNSKRFFRIFNYGVESYNQTNEMIYLIESLRDQNFDVVIFYDFVNESGFGYKEATKRSDQIPLSFTLSQLPTDGQLNRYAGLEEPLISKLKDFIRMRYSYRMLKFLEFKNRLTKEGITNFQAFPNKKARSIKAQKVVDNYYHNLRVIKALGEHYNFIPIFILQPTLFTKNTLSEFEKTIDHLKQSDYIIFIREVYEKAKLKLVESNLVVDFSDIFYDRKDTIYIDDCHMSSVGNLVIARRMKDLVLDIYKPAESN